MPPETLTFACPACHTRLTVPTSLAGVIGPCPSCGTRIQAPMLPAAAPAPVPVMAAASPSASDPSETVAPVLQPQSAGDSKPGYRPEPRQLPARPDGMEPVGKPVSEAMREPSAERPRPRRGGWFVRLMIPLLFLGAIVAVVWGVVFAMMANPAQPPKTPGPQPDPSESGVRKIQPEDDLPLAPVEPDESSPVIPPLPDPPVRVDPSSRPDTRPSEAVSALQVLEQFLDATTLDERLPHMEGRTERAELEAGCLAKPLPEHVIEPAMQSDNPVENYTDFVFKVTFAKPSGGQESHDLLVRRRGNQEPKVVTDPFLDLYGGRLLAFASAPGDNKHGTFQVLISANSSCTDTTIPNHDKKITLKLIGTLTGKEIASAYAGRASAIGEMLENDQSGLRWGRAKACTILLSWNTRDNPDRPYLEASSIKALNWNP